MSKNHYNRNRVAMTKRPVVRPSTAVVATALLLLFRTVQFLSVAHPVLRLLVVAAACCCSCCFHPTEAWCLQQQRQTLLVSPAAHQHHHYHQMSRYSVFIPFHRRHQRRIRSNRTPSSSSPSALWETSGNNNDRDGRRRRGREEPYDLYDEDEEDEEEEDYRENRRASTTRPTTTRRSSISSSSSRDYDYYYDEDDYYEEEDNDSDNDNYIQPPRRVEWEEVQVPNDPFFNDNYDYNDDNDPSFSTVYVLLPPSPPTMHPLPSAVLHFVGGTVFGSAPKTFYRSLLEDIVKHTQCAIVVTPIPIITPLNARKNGSGPLNHVQMAKSLQYQFQYAYQHVLEDEYGGAGMENVPIAGLGHSLGSRLLVVLATLMAGQEDTMNTQEEPNTENTNNEDIPNNSQRRPQRRRRRRQDMDDPRQSNYLSYKSMILISFTNFGASVGIPGISSLTKQRRKIDEKTKQQQQDRRRRRVRDENDQQSTRQTTTVADRSNSRRRRRGRGGNDWWDDDDDDDDIEDLFEEWANSIATVRGLVQDQADIFKTKLTPQAKDLEFHPTPRELWTALEPRDEDNSSRYRIPQTLLIQFDRDDMDQSAKLATVLLKSSSSSTTTIPASSSSKSAATNISSNTTTTTSNGGEVHGNVGTTTTSPTTVTDLKFAPLRGTHLTPVATSSSQLMDNTIMNETMNKNNNRGLWQEWSTKVTKTVWNAIQGRVVGGKAEGGNMSQEEALRDLRQTITRYIADVVTK